MDPWARIVRNHFLPDEIRVALYQIGIIHLNQVVDPLSTNLWHKGWKDGRRLDLKNEKNVIWDRYMQALISAHIKITDREDNFIWDLQPTGLYSPKAFYI
jgi:hypothetical protein